MNMKTMETQIGISEGADFEQSTWTFKMSEKYIVRVGHFAIVDKPVYDEMMIALKVLRNYFGRNDKTVEEHKMYDIADKAIALNYPELIKNR